MEFVTRLASPGVARLYPLNISGVARWQHVQRAGQPTWLTEIHLPALPAEHIVVPSYIQLGHSDYRYQFTWQHSADVHGLNPVPDKQPIWQPADPQSTPRATNTPISSHIDCWHTHQLLPTTVVQLWVESTEQPADYLLTLNVRPLTLPTENLAAPGTTLKIDVPANLSQMQADLADIRRRICSPTALATALSAYVSTDWDRTIEACFDAQTNAYGAWPLATRWAAQQGIISAVETYTNWDQVMRVLGCGSPLVCSIRFKAGALTGAPLQQTGGHLVLLYGVDPHYVWVKDPAARTHAEVLRRYPVTEFSAAWLGWRGAAYTFASQPNSV